jgi:AraC-like DNA-binding protein
MQRAVARSSLIHMLPPFLEERGIRAEPIYRQAGMGAEHMIAALPVQRAQIHAALQLAARATGEPDIALSLGALAEAPRLGPPGLAMLNGQTFESCLRAHMALMPRLQTHHEERLWTEGRTAIFSIRLVGDNQAAWLLYEGAAAFMVKMARGFFGAGWSPDLVTFPHPCRGRLSAYEAYFRGPVIFDSHSAARISFPSELLKSQRRFAASTPPREQSELTPIGQFCPVQLERFSLDASIIQHAVTGMAEAAFTHSAITIEVAADRLGLSTRTLQRRLLERGRTFEAVIDDVRRRVALTQLDQTTQPITEIAMSLGYSDAAHFTRAFRRWMGVSPSEYRNRSRGMN